MNLENETKVWWTDLLTEREQLLIRHATVYSDAFSESGAPGHNQFMLIAKLAEMLNRVSSKTGSDIPALYAPEKIDDV